MKVKNIDIITSPDDANRLRLVGEVVYDNKDLKPELYWFEVDKKYKDDINTTGNPWLICLLPLAVTIGEPIQICNSIDSKLLENAKQLMQIWKCWYPDLHIIPIEAKVVNYTGNVENKKTAAFFSGGVDSFFTLLFHNDPTLNNSIHIDDLISVFGFDIPLKNKEAFSMMKENFQKVASELGKELIDVATNLRKTHFNKSGWGKLSHGCALASIAHLLGNRLSKVLIASTGGYTGLIPWGSHPLTDPLLSGSDLTIIHDGAAFNRLQKTEFISKYDLARKYLHVCYSIGTDKNCSQCVKCYRTMMMLDVLDEFKHFETFDKNKYSIAHISKFYNQVSWDYKYMNMVRSLAVIKKRIDLIKAIDSSFKHSKYLDIFLLYARKIEKWLKYKRFLWRYAGTIERWLLKGSIYKT